MGRNMRNKENHGLLMVHFCFSLNLTILAWNCKKPECFLLSPFLTIQGHVMPWEGRIWWGKKGLLFLTPYLSLSHLFHSSNLGNSHFFSFLTKTPPSKWNVSKLVWLLWLSEGEGLYCCSWWNSISNKCKECRAEEFELLKITKFDGVFPCRTLWTTYIKIHENVLNK